MPFLLCSDSIEVSHGSPVHKLTEQNCYSDCQCLNTDNLRYGHINSRQSKAAGEDHDRHIGHVWEGQEKQCLLQSHRKEYQWDEYSREYSGQQVKDPSYPLGLCKPERRHPKYIMNVEVHQECQCHR